MKRLLSFILIVGILGFSFPFGAEAAPTYVTSGIDDTQEFAMSGDAVNYTVNAGASTDNTVLYVMHCWRNRTPSLEGMTYNGVAMTSMGAQITVGVMYCQMYRLVNPATGSNTLAVDPASNDSGTAFMIMSYAVYSGVDQTTPEDGYTTATGSGTDDTTSSLTVTSATGDAPLVFHFLKSGNNPSGAAETNFTQRAEDFNTPFGGGVTLGEGTGAASVATSVLWTMDAVPTDWGAMGVNMNATASASSPTPKLAITNGRLYLGNTVTSSLDSGILAYWPLNESSGNAIDAVGSVDGTVTGATQGATCGTEGAYSFDGTNDFVNFGNNLSFERTDTRSFQFYINQPATPTTPETVYSKVDESTFNGPLITIRGDVASDPIEFELRGSSTYLTIRANPSTAWDGACHSIVITYSGNSASSGVNIYMDGTLLTNIVDTANLTQTIVNTANLTLGALGSTLQINDFSGSIGRVAVWDRVLTAAEVTALSAGPLYPYTKITGGRLLIQ